MCEKWCCYSSNNSYLAGVFIHYIYSCMKNKMVYTQMQTFDMLYYKININNATVLSPFYVFNNEVWINTFTFIPADVVKTITILLKQCSLYAIKQAYKF